MREKERLSWDAYFMLIANAVKERATCPRASVGAVLVKNNRIVSTGFNGSPQGQPHCTDAGCLVVDGHCQRTLHAEVNAVAYAARAGVSVEGARLYLAGTNGRTEPCRECSKVLIAAGVEWGGA